ncbi:hypothetical protein Pelo_9603 [Pelomyxa schiedti]|nr:hypothetical protein Pelo_9603 [Pelomyxa schiedti]
MRGLTLPSRKEVQEEVVRGHRSDDDVASIVGDAIKNLRRSADDAEKRADEVTAEIDGTLTTLRAEMVAMVDRKAAELKAEVRKSLMSHLNALKLLNMEYVGMQRFICPEERVVKELTKSLNTMFILQGTHIVDLPDEMLAHIVGYLPLKSITATRAVCHTFCKAVQMVYGCKDHTFSMKAKRNGSSWAITGGSTFSTPCMDFKVMVESNAAGMGVHLAIFNERLYGQAKAVDVKLTTTNNNKKKLFQERHIVITTTKLRDMFNGERGPNLSFHFTGGSVPSQVKVSLTINDTPLNNV